MNWNEQRISRQLKLGDLHVLMTVARSGSMGKAANQLSVSQPALSKAVADMEAALGVRLLDRNPRGRRSGHHDIREVLVIGTIKPDEFSSDDQQ